MRTHLSRVTFIELVYYSLERLHLVVQSPLLLVHKRLHVDRRRLLVVVFQLNFVFQTLRHDRYCDVLTIGTTTTFHDNPNKSVVLPDINTTSPSSSLKEEFLQPHPATRFANFSFDYDNPNRWLGGATIRRRTFDQAVVSSTLDQAVQVTTLGMLLTPIMC